MTAFGSCSKISAAVLRSSSSKVSESWLSQTLSACQLRPVFHIITHAIPSRISSAYCRAISCNAAMLSLLSFLYSGGFSPAALKALNESALGEFGAILSAHVLVELAGVASFQFFIDSRHMDAEVDRNVGRTSSGCVFRLDFLAVAECQISVVSHVLTSLSVLFR